MHVAMWLVAGAGLHVVRDELECKAGMPPNALVHAVSWKGIAHLQAGVPAGTTALQGLPNSQHYNPIS